jgi:hypothetical protein
MFNVNEFVNGLTVETDNTDVRDAKVLIENVQLLTDDPWLSRAFFWGATSAMENQISFLGGRLLPGLEQRLNKIDPASGVLGESNLAVSWTSNEDKLHVNDAISVEDRIMETQSQIDNLLVRMKTASIIYVITMQAHDSISNDLDQLTFAQIKQSATSKRQAAEKTAMQQRMKV